MEADSTDPSSVKKLIASHSVRPLVKAFSADDPAHVQTLLALRDAELRILANARLNFTLAALALRLCNAMSASFRLGDRAGALEAVRGAVRWGYDNLEAVRTDTGVAALHGDAEFNAIFTDPALLAERKERMMPRALVAISKLKAEDELGDIDFEPSAHLHTPDEAREFLKNWTGSDQGPWERLRIFGEDGTGGTAAIWRTDKSKPLESEPVVWFGSEGALGVEARDLGDLFVLLAQGIGRAVYDLLRDSFPDSVERSVAQALGDAKKALPGFEAEIRALVPKKT